MINIKFDCAQSGCFEVIPAPNETVLDALLRSDVPVPFYCRAGICGRCESVLAAGQVKDVGTGPHLLTPEKEQQGHILLCRSRALTDCEIRPVNPIPSRPVSRWSARNRVDICRTVDDSLLHLRLSALDKQDGFSFRAGQYTRFEAENAFLSPFRLFLASRPGLPYLEFYLPLDEQTRSMATELRPGSEVSLSEPTGSASLGGDEAEPVVIIAERSGVASALGMIDMLDAIADPPPAFILLIGSGYPVLERIAIDHAQHARIEANLLTCQDMLMATLENALNSPPMQTKSSDKKLRVFIKAGLQTTKLAREILFRHGVRPWHVYADNVD